MRIFLIRHGETDWNVARRVMGVDPIPLNENGRKMVRDLARVLSNEGIDTIYSSTVERAMESAGILSREWNAGIVEEPRLNECRFEPWVGKLFDELRDLEDFKLYFTRPTESRFSTSETMRDIQSRAVAAIERIISEKRSGNVAAVTHSDIVKPILAHYLGMDLDLMHRFLISNASVTLLDFSGRFMRIPYINSTPWKWVRELEMDSG